MLAVLSPSDHTGSLASDIDGVSVGSTPLTSQYSGRYICWSNSVTVKTETAVPVTSGGIQVGAVPGGAATVIVPACSVPVAWAGTLPNAPGSAELVPVLLPGLELGVVL